MHPAVAHARAVRQAAGVPPSLTSAEVLARVQVLIKHVGTREPSPREQGSAA